jgi:Na+-transporting methylmalonyl-CoA/oxaloacetate decarboxylase beta subunit
LLLLRNEKKDPSDNSKPLSSSSLVKISFPIILIFLILALLPSSTSIWTSTLFLGFLISSISTAAPYLPLEA